MLVPIFKTLFSNALKRLLFFVKTLKSKSKIYKRLGLFKYIFAKPTRVYLYWYLMYITVHHHLDLPAHFPYLTLSGVRSGNTSGNKCAAHPFATSRSTSHISSNVAKNPMTANPSTMGPINESSELNTSENMDAVLDDLLDGV